MVRAGRDLVPRGRGKEGWAKHQEGSERKIRREELCSYAANWAEDGEPEKGTADDLLAANEDDVTGAEEDEVDVAVLETAVAPREEKRIVKETVVVRDSAITSRRSIPRPSLCSWIAVFAHSDGFCAVAYARIKWLWRALAIQNSYFY